MTGYELRPVWPIDDPGMSAGAALDAARADLPAEAPARPTTKEN